jgi:hypothetical protein
MSDDIVRVYHITVNFISFYQGFSQLLPDISARNGNTEVPEYVLKGNEDIKLKLSVPLRAMKALRGRGEIAPIDLRPQQ